MQNDNNNVLRPRNKFNNVMLNEFARPFYSSRSKTQGVDEVEEQRYGFLQMLCSTP